MKCLHCASENRDKARYCGNCGQPLGLSLAAQREAAESSSQSSRIGLRLQNNRYIIKRVLGQGRVETTLLATDTCQDNQLVVIRSLTFDHTDSSKTQEDPRNLKREVMNLACIAHPLIPKVIESFEE